MANGDLDLTVGGMKSIMDTVHLQENMSNADRKLIENAMANAITEAQFKDEKVMKAMAKMPEWAQHKLKAEIYELLTRGDLNMHNANTVRDHLIGWKHENLGWLRANDEWGTYAASMAENLVDEVVKLLGYIVAARNVGSAAGTAAKAASNTKNPEKDWMQNMENALDRLGTGGRRMDMAPSKTGVQSMKK